MRSNDASALQSRPPGRLTPRTRATAESHRRAAHRSRARSGSFEGSPALAMHVRLLSHRPESGWSDPFARGARLRANAGPGLRGDRLRRTNRGLGRPRPRISVEPRLGCSSAGEILGEPVAEGSLVAAVVRFEHATVTRHAAPIQAVEVSRSTGGKIARVLAPHAPRLVLVVSDGLHVNGTDLVRGLAEGAAGGDGDRRRTRRRRRPLRADLDAGRRPAAQRLGDAPSRSCGPLEIGTGSAGGWEAFGPERRGHARPTATCSTNSTASRRSRSTRTTSAISRRGLPATALLLPAGDPHAAATHATAARAHGPRASTRRRSR